MENCENDDVLGALDAARREKEEAERKEAESLAALKEQAGLAMKINAGLTAIAIEQVCMKCGQVADSRRWINHDPQHIRYVCKCTNYWDGKTLEQHIAESKL